MTPREAAHLKRAPDYTALSPILIRTLAYSDMEKLHFGSWGPIFIVKIQFSQFFPAPEGLPLLAVNFTAKLDWLAPDGFILLVTSQLP